MTVFSGLGLLLGGCVLKFSFDNKALLVCESSADCPDTLVCGNRKRCVDAESAANGVPGVSLSTNTAEVSELGSKTSLSLQLTSRPSAPVTIVLVSSDESEATVSPAVVTFTSDDWANAHLVTISGVPDCLPDGDITSTVIVAPAQSTDPDYAGVDAADVTVITHDDLPPAGISVTATSATTSELGATTQLSYVLSCKPTAEVTFSIATSDASEGVPSATGLAFTALNWNLPRIVTITGQSDCENDGNVAYTILASAAQSDDPLYNAADVGDIALSNVDAPSARVKVSPVMGLVTSETGGTASFTLALNCAPSADVSIALSSADPSEGTIDKAIVTFPVADWDTAQSVTITGQNDLIADGDVLYTIVTAASVSADSAYSGLDVDDVTVVNTDNDHAAITVNVGNGLLTSESGLQDTFSVVLTSQPTAPVTIAISSTNTLEGTVSPAALVFTALDWNTPKVVTVTGIDETPNNVVDDGDIVYTVVLAAATSSDLVYNGMDPADLSATNQDNDTSGVIVVSGAKVYVSESGTSQDFSFHLTTKPSADVTFDLLMQPAGEVALSVTHFVFTPATWNQTQTVTVTGTNDSVPDGMQVVAIYSYADSLDLLYKSVVNLTVYAFNVEPSSARKTFVTSNSFLGNLSSGAGGPSGADSLCAADAQASGGTYRAVVVQAGKRVACTSANCAGGLGEHLNWPFAPNITYLQADGRTVISTSDALGLFGSLFWNGFSSGQYWTGLTTDWLIAANCSDWTNNSNSLNGRDGYGGQTSSGGSFSQFDRPCDQATSLLCVQQ